MADPPTPPDSNVSDMPVFYAAWYPGSRTVLSTPDAGGTPWAMMGSRPEFVADAAVKHSQHDPEPYVVVKYIPVAVMERTFEQKSPWSAKRGED